MNTHTNQNIHHESALEKHIVDCLVREQGYLKRAPGDYERALAMDTEVVIRFIKETQPDEWEKNLRINIRVAQKQHFSNGLKRKLRVEGRLTY